jgi:hypothetical protein
MITNLCIFRSSTLLILHTTPKHRQYTICYNPTPPSPQTHLLLLSTRIVYRHFLTRTALLSLVHNLLPAQIFRRVLHKLNRREVVFVLLQRSDPRDVIKGDDLEPEVLVVADLLDFAEEGCEIGRGDVVDVC